MNTENIKKAAEALKSADAILIGASNGLSIAEGYHIFASNEMFIEQFGDMQRRFGFRSVIEGCFFRYPTVENRDEFYRRLVQYWVKEYRPSPVMSDLLAIVGSKDYFIVTSNGDTHLQLSGFDASKVFEIEGNFLNRFETVDDKNAQLQAFIQQYAHKRLVILELGIGMRNQLIKAPLMKLTAQLPMATYITLNLERELYIPQSIAHQSIGLAGDIAQVLGKMRELM